MPAPTLILFQIKVRVIGFGGACLVLTISVLSHRIRSIYRGAIRMRDDRGDALISFPYIACLLLVCFPVVASIAKFWIFLAPMNAHTIDFICETYEGVALYCFIRLLIMFLGSHHVLFEDAPKTKFYGLFTLYIDLEVNQQTLCSELTKHSCCSIWMLLCTLCSTG